MMDLFGVKLIPWQVCLKNKILRKSILAKARIKELQALHTSEFTFYLKSIKSRIPCYTFIMIISFADQATSDIFNGIESKQARKRLPLELWKSANRKLDQLDSIVVLEELKVPPGNRLEKLRGSREDQMSIRINDQYRICFTWGEAGAVNVEIIDYHS